MSAVPPWPHHQCPARDCTALVADGYVGCRTHWLRVPPDTRDVLTVAFRRRIERPDLFSEARRLAERLMSA